MSQPPNAAAELARTLMDQGVLSGLHIAAKTVRDGVVTPMLNRGVGDPADREEHKKFYLQLNRFVNAYENFIRSKGGNPNVR